MIRRLLPNTERARLTTLYGGLLLFAGCLLVAVIYALVQDGLDSRLGSAFNHTQPARHVDVKPGATASPGQKVVPSGQGGKFAETEAIEVVTDVTLSRLLTVSAIALAIFALLSVFLAWWMAGRVLRPVALITSTAHKISGESLHQRIDLKGPPGELKQLADTFDLMLGRMEHLVTAQQRFAANAAHELRTPLAIQRAAVEIGLNDPNPEQVKWIRDELLQVANSSEHLIESLLLLAASDQSLERREPVALEETTMIVAAGFGDEARERGITIKTTADPTTVNGDPVLLTHMIRNLVSNAARYNQRGGTIHIDVSQRTLTISNTGPVVPEEDAPRLFEPFRRLQARTHTAREGAGLGLSIVASIAQAHGAEATAHANPTGGLTVQVRFP